MAPSASETARAMVVGADATPEGKDGAGGDRGRRSSGVGAPAGLVFIACAVVGVATTVVRHDFAGTRAAVRAQTIDAALRLGQRLAAATLV